MRKIGTAAALLLFTSAPYSVAQTGPKLGKSGGIGASNCTFVGGEPIGGASCTFSIDGTSGTITAKDISPSGAKPSGGVVTRPLAEHLLDITNPVDFGAVSAGGSGDNVTGPALVKATSSTPRYSIWSLPYNGGGYVANADPTCTDPVYCYTGSINPGTLRNEAPGIYFLNNNAITGTMGGTPETGHGTFNSTYTNPYNVTTNLRMLFDPAAIPSRGPNVTYQGWTLECLPQRPNPNDSAANLAAKKRGAICAYMGMDTGTGAVSGSAYGSEVMNMVLNQGTNSGNALEINHNFNGQLADGQYSRTLFITGGGNYDNYNSSAIEINHGCYSTCADGGTGMYGTGIGVRGSVTSYWAQRESAGATGDFYVGFSETMQPVFKVNKQGAITGRSISIHNASDAQIAYIDTNGFVVAQGVESLGDVKTRSLTVVNGSNVTTSGIDTNGFITGAGVTSTGDMAASGNMTVSGAFRTVPKTFAALGGAGACNVGNEGYFATVTDSNTNVWGDVVTGGGSNRVLVYCNGTNWSVMAK